MFTFTWQAFLWLFLAAFCLGMGWTLGTWLMGRILAAIFK